MILETSPFSSLEPRHVFLHALVALRALILNAADDHWAAILILADDAERAGSNI